jgi:hypothetical protein
MRWQLPSGRNVTRTFLGREVGFVYQLDVYDKSAKPIPLTVADIRFLARIAHVYDAEHPSDSPNAKADDE